ncbi:hypothetical protein [Scopulibacillus daqui]|uniref:hypothetical protein n=1 Tax=Scopulibacillus daqui TaxID=1469162 RepID=UPI001960B9EC|nr:hypothetical protein [Scopulibacillus daqui]
MYKFLNDGKNAESEIKSIFKKLSRMDTYSYNRAEIIIHYLNNNFNLMKSSLSRLERSLDDIKNQGYYIVEKELLKELKIKCTKEKKPHVEFYDQE